jgi:tetratricopeptide (TPR) repeat protein
MASLPLTESKAKPPSSASFDPTSQNQRIHDLFVRKNYKECLEAIETQVKKFEGTSEYPLYVKGLILRQEGKIQESLLTFEKVVELNPVSLDNLKQVGKTYMLLGRFKEAIDNFDQAIQLQTDPDWECLHNKAMCLQQLGNEETVCFSRLKHLCTFPFLFCVFLNSSNLTRLLKSFYRLLK